MQRVLEQAARDLLPREITPMQKERVHMQREVHHTPRDIIQLLKVEIPTRKVQIHRQRMDKNTLKAGSTSLIKMR